MARRRNTNVFDAKLDVASYNRAIKRISKYEGRNWRGRVIAAFIEGARLLVQPMRRAAPKRSGRLGRSIQAKLARKGINAVVKVNTKPRRPKGSHGHLVAQGTSRGATANPYIERVIDKHEDRVVEFIKEQPLDIDGAGVSSLVERLRSF